MRCALAIVMIAACVPEETAIGTTAWTVGQSELLGADVGRGGELAITNQDTLTLIDRDGMTRWSTSLSLSGGRVVVARDGGVVLAKEATADKAIVLDRYAGSDGALEWSLTFPDAHATGLWFITVDESDATWLVFDHTGTSDLGGGPIGTADERTARWGRFARDGTYLGSGVFSFALGFSVLANGRALPGGGIAIRNEARVLGGFDESGNSSWQIEGPVGAFVVHDDGEITLSRGYRDLERYAADRSRRWRRSHSCMGTWTALADGSVIFVGQDGLGDRGELGCIQRFDANGDAQRELIEFPAGSIGYGANLAVWDGGPTDGYRMSAHAGGNLDLHDRTIEVPQGGAIISRQFP